MYLYATEQVASISVEYMTSDVSRLVWKLVLIAGVSVNVVEHSRSSARKVVS